MHMSQRPTSAHRHGIGALAAQLRGVDCSAEGVLPLWILRGTYVATSHRSGAQRLPHVTPTSVYPNLHLHPWAKCCRS